jgi:hypothetical protein
MENHCAEWRQGDAEESLPIFTNSTSCHMQAASEKGPIDLERERVGVSSSTAALPWTIRGKKQFTLPSMPSLLVHVK